MKKKIVKLTESDLEKLVQKIIKEEYDQKIDRSQKETNDVSGMLERSHLAPKRGPIDTEFSDPSFDTDVTIVTRIKVLRDTLKHFKKEGDIKMVDELRGYIQTLEQELRGRNK